MYNYLDVFFKLRRESNDTLMKCLSEEMEGLRVVHTNLNALSTMDLLVRKQLNEVVDEMLNISNLLL